MKGNVYALKLERKPFADEYNSKGQRLPRFAVRKATGKTPAQAYMSCLLYTSPSPRD